MDTSMPYVYAYHGLDINEAHEDLKRPDNYFELEPEEFNTELLTHNITTLEGWAHG
jgi:hypothetical protein